MGAGDADTVAGEDDGLEWWGIGHWIDNGIGVNAGVWIWRGISIGVNVSAGRDAGVGADDGCDWIGCGWIGCGVNGFVRIWRGAGCGNDAGAWRRD